MSWISSISFDEITLSIVTLCMIRETMIQFLPDRVAGPGGWLIDTGSKDM